MAIIHRIQIRFGCMYGLITFDNHMSYKNCRSARRREQPSTNPPPSTPNLVPYCVTTRLGKIDPPSLQIWIVQNQNQHEPRTTTTTY